MAIVQDDATNAAHEVDLDAAAAARAGDGGGASGSVERLRIAAVAGTSAAVPVARASTEPAAGIASDGAAAADVRDLAAVPDLKAVPVAAAPGLTGSLDLTAAPESRTGNDVPEVAVTAMFDDIVPVYDRLNTLMTLGADRRWRREAVAATGLSEGGSAIDVACGTGRLSAALADRVGPFGHVLGVDLSPAMIEHAARANRDIVQLEFRVANALALPAGDGEFDAATIAFGLRNLADFEGGFRELRRVVRPGGTVVCLELTQPRPRPWAATYRALFGRAAPLLGGLFGHRDAYRYLPASIQGFPDARAVAATMRRAGLVDVTWRRLGLGTVALHRGRVPS